MTTRFPHGVSTAESGTLFGSYPRPDPTDPGVFFDDFMQYDAITNSYTVTPISNGSLGLIDGLGGVVELATTVDGGSAIDLILPSLGFEFLSGKGLWFEMGVEFTSADDTIAIHLGLQDEDGATPANAWHVNHTSGGGLYHVNYKSGDANQLAGIIQVAELVSGVPIAFGFHWDGISKISNFVDGVLVLQTDMTDLALPLGLLSPSIGIVGNGVVGTYLLDYIFAAQER